ncbi:MAG: 4-hydroxy-tetrahydrodipicolinate reductase [Bacteroidales bacterium]
MLKIALVGYGKMGRRIAEMVPGRGMEVGAVIDKEEDWAVFAAQLKHCDVAIEFSVPAAAFRNITRLLDAGIPVVSGTTGWDEYLPAIKAHADKLGVGLMVASNFSIGMNLFFALNRNLAGMMGSHPDYSASLREVHHIHKLDAPSGTAKTLAADLVACHPGYSGWMSGSETPETGMLPVESVREGEVTGIHEITFRGGSDRITIAHEAFSRDGFATGAMAAATWIVGKNGFHTMQEMLFGDITAG